MVFVAPYFTETAKRFIAATLGVPDIRVAVVSQDPLEALPPAVAPRIPAHWRIDDSLDPRQVEHAARALAEQHGRIHRLLGIVEQIQVPLAEVRERLGIDGMRVAEAQNFRDKAQMKERLRAAGIPCARHRVIVDEAEAWDFIREVGYPVVMKPPGGAAAQSTYRANGPEELREALRASDPAAGREALLEEFIVGDEHSFDSLSLDGNILFHSIARYLPGPLTVLENPWIQWTAVVPREADAAPYDDIRALAARALKALGMGTGMSHLEWFRRPDGSLAISEVGARPPGAQFTTIISRANGFDCEEAWARLVVHGAFEPPADRPFAAGAAYLRGQGRGRVAAVRGLEEADREIGHLVTDRKLPQVGHEAGKTYEGDGYVIVRHPETAVVEQALGHLVSMVRVEIA
ncbi:MAG: ATP-grasp domain-containing protein [Vicinamibacterales bacterium]